MRQIVLDTETTGLKFTEGHRIIEIGCVELVHRRITDNSFHQYLQPDRRIEAEASAVHGITDEFLKDQPRFAKIVDQFMDFIGDSELIIHNAEFDLGFINHELSLLRQNRQPIDRKRKIIDTLNLARTLHPGQKNNLDALCKRYEINNSQRTVHGALLDAQLLAEVYLSITGGQTSLLSTATHTPSSETVTIIKHLATDRIPLTIILPLPEELQAHTQRLATIDKMSKGKCLWKILDENDSNYNH
ncbi:MAG: DNA polymerase III subunit epsilon [Beggiatoa sp. IS2]|nr:MAG: DNA polymerase III subunit epsilon [Beggiatoa sp. IS2]